MADETKQPEDDNFFDPHAERKKEELYVAPEKDNLVKKGAEVNLTRKDPAFKNALVGIGWDLKQYDRDPPDLDASVFLLNKNDKTRVDEDFIFYGNLSGCDGAVKHTGDSRTGAGEGDDETILLDLNAIPFDVLKIVFTVSIYDLDMSENNFTHVKNVYFRLVNQETGHEILRYDLDDELHTTDTGMIVGELERIGADWIFRAVGENRHGGLVKIAALYGIIVLQDIPG